MEGSIIDRWRQDVLEHTGIELSRKQAVRLWVELMFFSKRLVRLKVIKEG